MEMLKNCKLCQKPSKLQQSHIIPKFVFNWMKETGTGRLRNVKKFSIPLQDGIKEYLLCSKCEEKFSKYEKFFKENLFDGFLSGNKSNFENKPELLYYSVSVLWRVLIYCRNEPSQGFQNQIELVEDEWRNFLLGNSKLNQFPHIQLLFLPEHFENTENRENLYSYFHRAVDLTIAEINTKLFVYSKFSRFVLIGQVSGIEEKDFIGSNLSQIETLTYPQEIKDGDVVDFMFGRVNNVKVYKDLSSPQKIKNDNYFESKLSNIRGTDYWNAANKDRN